MSENRTPAPSNLAELLTGGLVIGFGLFVAWEASTYRVGTVAVMGPGFFPLALGIMLVAFGIAITIQAAGRGEPSPAIPLRPLAAVSAGILAWALMAERLGLIPATFALVAISALAEERVRPIVVMLLAAGLCVIGVLLFVRGLMIPLPPIRW
jgi:CHASE2 domain-containing sensor protein